MTGSGSFVLPGVGQQKMRFVVVGDPRAYDSTTQNLIRGVVADKPDLVIATGDFIHKAGDPVLANWTEGFQAFQPLFESTPFMPSVGVAAPKLRIR